MGGVVRARCIRSNRPTGSTGSGWVARGAPLLLLLYLGWIAFPALHQLHLSLERGDAACQRCPAETDDWQILSHSPDQPCSDPDHHHHPRPVHDEDHCPACRLGAGASPVLPMVGALLPPVRLAGTVVERDVLAPVTPALWTVSARAPPHPASV
jgi:hypothetical protein